MRRIDWFNRAPNAGGWLADSGLKVGALVEVNGHTYRYSTERGGPYGLDHVLTPVEAPLSSGHRFAPKAKFAPKFAPRFAKSA